MSEESKIRARYKAHADETGLCYAFKVFNLGSHGTVYVGCGLPIHHENEDANETDVDLFVPVHQAAQTDDDGARVIFQWPA